MIQYLFTMETLTKAKKNQLQYYISMNEIMNKFLLAGDKFMPEMHLTQPGFTYSACAPFTKKKERIQKFKETSDSRYIFQNKLYKACFHHCVAYVDFKNLPRKTVFDKILHDIPFNIAKILKYDGYQLEFASTVNKLLIKILLALMIQEVPENFTNQLLRNLKIKKYTYLLKTVSGVQICK